MKKIKEKRANKEMKKAHIDEYSATDKKDLSSLLS
jgi:hypothetical protein